MDSSKIITSQWKTKIVAQGNMVTLSRLEVEPLSPESEELNLCLAKIEKRARVLGNGELLWQPDRLLWSTL